MKVNRYAIPLLLLALWFGAIGVARLSGAWSTSGRDIAITDAQGNPDPQQIRGWMTLRDISTSYGIPLETLYAGIGADQSIDPNTAVKDLEGVLPNFETTTVREVVATYLSGPAVGTQPPPTLAPTQAAPVSGRMPAAEIRGSTTLAEVIEQCGVPLDYLKEKLNLPADVDIQQPLRVLKEQGVLDMETTRAVVEEYQTQNP